MYSWLEEELEQRKKAGLWRQMKIAEGLPTPDKIIIDQRPMINLCSNNYLGLAGHPEIKKAAAEAIMRWGCSATASRLMAGNTELHQKLETKISEFKETEAALVYPSGYMANLGIITALVGPDDIVYSDRLNHASIIDGIILSRADLRRYRHNDLEHLEVLLKKTEDHRGRKMIVTDTIFSMDGDVALLPEIISLARKYDCLVMVDEAHATGVLGVKGRGAVEYFGLEGKIDVQMGTLSKALGAQGGYVAGSKQLIDFLVNKSRAFIYTTGLSPAMAGAALKALEIIKQDTSLKDKLWQNVSYFRQKIVEAGFDIGQSQTQIIPIMVGNSEKAVEFSQLLCEEGIFTRAVRPPTVPEGQARIRISITASHTESDLEKVVQVFTKVSQKLGLLEGR